MRARLVALLLLLVASAPLTAQGDSSRRDCNLARKAGDDPFGGKGFYLRRWQWHVGYAAASTLTAEALHQTTGMPRLASALTATLALGLMPHAIGLATHQYRLNLADVAFDLVDRSTAILLWTGTSGGTWQSKTLALTTFAGAYGALACYASP